MKYEELLSAGPHQRTGAVAKLRQMAPGDVAEVDDSWSKAVDKAAAMRGSIRSGQLSLREYKVRAQNGKVYVVRLKPEDIK